MERFCRKCGKPLSGNFCTYCGAAAVPSAQPDQYRQPQSNPQKRAGSGVNWFYAPWIEKVAFTVVFIASVIGSIVALVIKTPQVRIVGIGIPIILWLIAFIASSVLGRAQWKDIKATYVDTLQIRKISTRIYSSVYLVAMIAPVWIVLEVCEQLSKSTSEFVIHLLLYSVIYICLFAMKLRYDKKYGAEKSAELRKAMIRADFGKPRWIQTLLGIVFLTNLIYPRPKYIIYED